MNDKAHHKIVAFAKKALPTAHKVILEKLLAKHLPKLTKNRVLVVGAGHESYERFYGATSFVVGIDLSHSKKTSVLCDAHVLPFKSNSFDTVVCTEVLEHCICPKTVVNEIHRVVCDGGTVVASTPFLFHVHADPNDYQRFTAAGLQALFAGFANLRIWVFGGRVSVIGDLITTYGKSLIPLRLINVIFRLIPADWLASEVDGSTRGDAGSGYLITAQKQTV